VDPSGKVSVVVLMVDPSDEGSATEGEAGFVATKLGWSEAGAEVEAPG